MSRMKITDNLNVVRAWTNGKNARNHRFSLKSIDGALFSYGLKIGVRTNTGVCVITDYTAASKGFHSQTTSCHVNLAKRFADEVFHPKVSAASPLFREEVPF
jgi:hypothetical protein